MMIACCTVHHEKLRKYSRPGKVQFEEKNKVCPFHDLNYFFADFLAPGFRGSTDIIVGCLVLSLYSEHSYSTKVTRIMTVKCKCYFFYNSKLKTIFFWQLKFSSFIELKENLSKLLKSI